MMSQLKHHDMNDGRNNNAADNSMMIVKHIYLNNIKLKTRQHSQLKKRKYKTTSTNTAAGYSTATYWRPSSHNNTEISPSTICTTPLPSFHKTSGSKYMKLPYPLQTDERNIKTSHESNKFNITTKMKHIHLDRSTSAVKSMRAITGRSLFSSMSSYNGNIQQDTNDVVIETQQTRHMREYNRKLQTRERRRLSQVSSHRIDRMYYMQGSASKLYQRNYIDDKELKKIQQNTNTTNTDDDTSTFKTTTTIPTSSVDVIVDSSPDFDVKPPTVEHVTTETFITNPPEDDC